MPAKATKATKAPDVLRLPAARGKRKATHPSTRACALAAARHLATAWQEPVCVIRAERDGGPFVRRQSLCAGVDPRRVIETVQPGVPWIGDGT